MTTSRWPRARRVGRTIWEGLKSLQVVVLVFVLVRALVVEAFRIPSGSMEGTLLIGDFLLVNKLLYGAELPVVKRQLPPIRDPRHGDVVVFRWPEDPRKHFVKRLVGLPGDTLEMRQGVLVRNGMAQQEGYAHQLPELLDGTVLEFAWQRDHLLPAVDASHYFPSRDDWGPLVVAPRHYFVLGDNRDNSLDSRYWGFVPDSLIRGAPLLVYFILRPDSTARAGWTSRVRWDRLGAFVE
ncbi:MAG: signal peptidase I [Gemmatimonadota bacterium]